MEQRRVEEGDSERQPTKMETGESDGIVEE